MIDDFDATSRIVIKVGSALLTGEDGRVAQGWLDSLAEDVAWLRRQGKDVLIVTSGAIAVGSRRLDLARRPVRLEEKQATAAVGQIVLAHAWQEALRRHGLETGQILLTLDDTEGRRRYLNARATVDTLIRMGVVPVVNENDTVATSEIRFGDNDRLSARVAVMAMADTLILLSDVDGLYDRNPNLHGDARHIARVETITGEIEAMATGTISGVGTGGMASKIEAARIATNAGCSVIVTLGKVERPIRHLLDSGRCTVFNRQRSLRAARKEWIAGALSTAGMLTIDDGACRALERGSSLLPAGVIAAEGDFSRGDTVLVCSSDGTQIARGLVAYDKSSAEAIIGRNSREIPDILGYDGRHEIIHRDDLVLL